MAYSNIVRSIPLSIALFVVLSKAHQICNNTSECPDEYFCDIYLNNNNELSQSECKPCITCTDYNRQSISICSEGIQQCGPCQTGFTYTSASVTDCVAIDNQKTKCNNCEITPTGISKVTTTDIILVFLLILPVSGVVVIGITLFIGYIYKKHIQKKSLVNDQYFHYRIINL